MDLVQMFQDLESTINGSEPTVERCRDWAAKLAYLCGELADKLQKNEAATRRALDRCIRVENGVRPLE